MTKVEAVKNARIGALMQGGTWYVTRRGKQYDYTHADSYMGTQLDGAVAEMFTPDKVRGSIPGK